MAADDPIEALRGFLVEHLPPAWVAAVDAGDDDAVAALKADLDADDFVRRLGGAGWVVPQWAPEHGGRGLDPAAARAVADELDTWGVPRFPIGSGIPLAAPTILEWSSEETKRRLLPPMATGEERWCQLFSEPGAGSDLASLATTAVRDGDEWVVNGQKVWTTFGHVANFAMLLARTDPAAPKHKGITYFGIDLRGPGVEVRPLVNMTGEHEFNEVFMTDARVPDLYRISPVGEGWGATLTTLSAERFALSGTGRKKRRAPGESESEAAGILGGKSFAAVRTLATALGRTADPVLRQRLARAHTDAQVLRWTIGRARTDGAIGSITKILKASSNQSLQVLAMDLLGARSQAWDADDADVPGFVREFLRTRANSIEGGTSEIQRNIVGERVLGLPKEPDPFHGAPWKSVPRS
jgi:alkylation response protein AidB-like acyl-CoA dehydrogenase